MVMTQQPPPSRGFRSTTTATSRKNSGTEEDEYWGSSAPVPASISSSARRRTSPPRVPVAAAAASGKQDEGLSLYEELLRYHRENPEEEDRLKQEQERQVVGTEEDDDRKPAALPTEEEGGERSPSTRKKSMGTYRVPVSREYFAAKDSLASPGTPSKNRLTTISSPQQQERLAVPYLGEWDDPSPRGTKDPVRNNYPSNFPEELPAPFADSFHDNAEDEALARQLQAEEEERVATFQRRFGGSTSSMPPLLPMTPSHRSSCSERDDSLAHSLAELSVTPTTPAAPSHRVQRAPSVTFERFPHSEPREEEEVAKQQKILRDIAEENERKQIEWALQESRRATEQRQHTSLPPRHSSPPPANHRGPGMSDLSWQAARSPVRSKPLDWEVQQRAALEEFARKQRESRERGGSHTRHQHRSSGDGDGSAGSEAPHQPIRSSSSYPREVVLQRGHQETAQAIRTGQAHIVRCRGCSGKLQAPKQYSMVYCPKCGHVSPVE